MWLKGFVVFGQKMGAIVIPMGFGEWPMDGWKRVC